MNPSNPLTSTHAQDGAGFIPYGPVDADQTVQVVDTFGLYEAEYAAIRKTVGLMDLPHRGVVEVTGGGRIDFLHRMLTNDTAGLEPGQGRRAMLLDRTGRIGADMIVLHDSERTCLETDVFQTSSLVAELEGFVFTEDVQLRDASDSYVRLALHGPAGADVLKAVGNEPVEALSPLSHRRLTLAGHPCTVFRSDETGTPGLHLMVPRQGAVAVYDALKKAVGGDAAVSTGKPIGWLAYNTARIEAGTPLYHIDFGKDTLPHETGVLDQAVSFTKGCYRGQEIVARLHNLGHPKRVLVGLRLADDRLPIAGSQVLEPDEPTGDRTGTTPRGSTSGSVIGGVTSSCVSPMLGGKAVAFAMVKWGMHEPGTPVVVPAEGQLVVATVGPLASL